MAILAIIKGNNVTKNMYEDVRKDVKWEQNHPAGAIFHVSGFDDSGNLYVADVWESEDQLNNFISTRIKPAMEKIRAPEIKIEVYPVHNVNAFLGIDKYRV